MPFTFFHAMAYVKGDFNFHIPLGFFVMLWSNDTGAYLTGRGVWANQVVRAPFA
jgi:phosphatidate cytidylyltransferase